MRLDRAALLRTTALVALAMPAHAQLAPNARPTGGMVSAGQATIGTSPTTTTITQQSQRASLNWQSFNVGSAQTVQFNQPGSQAIALNRVLSGDPSQIGGRILANGQVVLINQSGVVFTRGSQVDTAGLVVSASGMSDRNFMAGHMVFDQAAHSGAVVSNAGNITIRQAGLAALVAPQVANSGAITATMGRVVLGGAVTHTLDLYGDGLVALNVTGQVTQASLGGKRVTALVTNSGTILAPGGSVVLTAAAVDGVVSNLVTAGGTIAAASAGGRNGRVLVQGIGGGVEVDGDVSASGTAPGTTGGQVAVDATGAVGVASGATIDASGMAGGGAIAIGTTIARAVRGPSAGSAMTAKSVAVSRGASVRADATASGHGGRITLLSREVTAQSGTLSAQGGPTGGDGGWIEVSGKGQLDFGGQQLTGAPAGHAGTLTIDPADLIIGNSGGGTSTALITPAQFNAFTGDVIIKADGTLSVTANATLNAAATSLELSGGEGVLIGGTLDAHAVPVTLISATGNISDQDGNLTGSVLARSLQAFTRGGSVTLDNGPDSYSSVGSIAVTGDTAQGLVASLGANNNLVTRAPDTRDAYATAGVTSLDGSVDLTDTVPLQIFYPVAAGGGIFIDDTSATGTTVLAANITANTIDIAAAAINQSLGLVSTGTGNGNITITSNGTVGGGISIGGTITDVFQGEGFGGTVSLSTISGNIVEAGSAGGITGLITADALQASATGPGGSVALDNPNNAIATLTSGNSAQSFSLTSDNSTGQGGLFVQGAVNGGQTLSLTSSGITLSGFGGDLSATQRIVLQADSFDLSAPVSAPTGDVFIDRLTPGTLAVGGTNDSFGTAALGNITSTILALGTTNGISPGVATGIDVESSLSSTATGSAFYAFAHQDEGTGGSITINAPVTYGTIGLEADSFAIGAAVTASGGLVGISLADAGTLTVGGATSALSAASIGDITAGTLSLGSLDGVTPGLAVSGLVVDGQIPFAGNNVALFAQGNISETTSGLIFAAALTGESAAGSIALPSQNEIGDIGALSASTGITVTVSGGQDGRAPAGLAIVGDVVTQTGTIAITSARGGIDLVGILQADAVALFAEDGGIVETIPEGGPNGSIITGALCAQADAGDVLLDAPGNAIARIAPVAGLTGLFATGVISLTDSIGVAITAPVTSGSGNIAITTATGDIAIAGVVQSGTVANGVFSGTVTLQAEAGNIVEGVAGQPGFGLIQAGTLAAQAQGEGGPYNITLNNPAGNDVAVIGPVGNLAGLEASGDVTFIGGQALSVAGYVVSNAGSVDMETTTGNLAIGGTVQSGDFIGGVYTGTATFTADAGNITETLPNGMSASGTILAGTLAAQAGFGGAAFDIVLDAAQNNQIAAIAAVGSLAGLSATGSVLFDGAQALTISGDVLSGSGPVQITTLDGGVALGGTLRAGTTGTGTATIVAEAGNITETLPGASAATGVIEAGTFAAQAGAEAGTNSVVLNTAAGNAIGTIATVGDLAGLSAGGAVELINAQALTVAGDVISTSGPVELATLAGDLVIGGTVQSGTLGAGAYGGTAILFAQAGNINETLPGEASASGKILAGTLAAAAGGSILLDNGNANLVGNIGPLANAGFTLTGLTAGGDILFRDGAGTLTLGNSAAGAIISGAGTIALSSATSILQSGGSITDTAGSGRILLDAPGTITIGGTLAAPNIVIGGMTAAALVEWNNATIETSSALAANGLKQALQGGLADTGPGVFVQAGRFVQSGTTSVNPLGTGLATVQIALTPGGSIDFGGTAASGGGLQAPSGELLLLLGTGTAIGRINVADLGVSFSQGGSATLTGSVSGLTQFAAAGAGVAFPSPDLAYTLNGCEIGGSGCGVPPAVAPLPFQIVPIYDPVAEVSAELLDTDLLDEALTSSNGRSAGFLVVEPEEDAFVGTVRKRRETDDVILPDVGTVDY